jgi:hypothetical protein
MNLIRKTIIAAVACAACALATRAPAQITAGTAYYIKNNFSGLVLNNGGSLTNGSPISQWNQVVSPNLQWTFVATSNGYYQIKSVKSGLDVVVKSASTTSGAPLIQWSFGSSGDDQWKPVLTNGFYTFFNKKSGMVINNPGSTANGAQYTQATWNKSSNQQFSLVTASTTTNWTAAQVLAGVQRNMVSSKQVNTQAHINTQTQNHNVNVYQVTSGVFAYSSSMSIDTDGSDADPDPDHLPDTTFQDDNGAQLGAHHVPYYVLGDTCFDGASPCKWFYYPEHSISGLQFALIFYNGKCIGAVFGDTQGPPGGDSRELGEASVESAVLLGIPSSGTTGGVDTGVTYVVFSGSAWVVHGTNSTLKDNAQALVQKALNTIGPKL